MLASCALAPTPLVPGIVLYRLRERLEHHWEAHGALPYWGHPWPGGQALARYLTDRPETVRGRTVLDLGCGSGLVAVAAAHAGARDVTAADVDPLARAATRLNADANGVRVRVVGTDLLAAGSPSGDAAAVRPWDVVLAGDVCYERGLAARMLTFLHDVAASGALVLLGDPGRAYLDPAGLHWLARYEVPTPEGVERDAVTPATVWRVGAAARG